jgi:hypothetical protein
VIARPEWDVPIVYTPTAPVAEEVSDQREVTPLDRSAVEHDLGPTGAVARVLAQYEDRESQREMAGVVADLYNDGGVGLLEAGTGVGKSLAYLVPALRWAANNGERTVVSTNTINLQEQLVRKDLPFLAKAFEGEQEVKFALLKGWRNYLCLLRLAQSKLLASTLLARGAGCDRRVGGANDRRIACRSRFSSATRSVGRNSGRTRSLSKICLPALRSVLSLPGPTLGGEGRCRGGESPSTDVRCGR